MSDVIQKNVIDRSYGFDPEESTHHFLVYIPRGGSANIEISEHFTWNPEKGSSERTYGTRLDGQIRVILQRPKWDAIADEVRAQFNQRIKKSGGKIGSWKVGDNLLRRELGKELVLLAWAIEDADPALIPAAIANWSGLVPEERWWLYTQTAAATGHGIADKGKGWRLAVRYALTENPITGRPPLESIVPEFFKQASETPIFKQLDQETSEE
jgi:hypothetical protein